MANNDIERDSTSFNEEIKKIRTNIKFSSVNDDVKVICVTSSLPGEGKSLISANLAASFAQYDVTLPMFLMRGCCSVAKSFPTLCDLVDCSMTGFPVLHYLLEFAQIHVH